MSLTKLQATLCDVFERIIINKEVFDPEYETLNFLFQAGLTPESETNQRYLQLVRTLRHEDYNQNRIRSLLPITILTTNYLVFNLPSYYSASVLADLRKDMKKDNAPNRDIIFWHFPKHHIPTDLSLQSLNIGPAMEEMIQLKIDPLYQFVGSVTAGNKPTVQQLKVKPGLLERKISMHFSSRSQSPNYSPSLRSERNQSTKSSQGRRKKGEELAANPKDFMSFGSRKNSRYPTITSNQSFEKTPRREGRSITITTDRSQDNSPVAQSSIALNKTPKFNETREFWMPKEYPGPNVSRQRRRTQKTVTNKSLKDISYAETSATSPHRSLLKSNTITLLDLLQKNPSPRKDLSIKLSRSRLDIQDNSDNMSPDNQSVSTVRGRAKSYTNARSERSPTREFTPEGMEGGQSDMSRETMRLLKQDRHDIYKDYDKQVERMHMRPFSKEKFEVRSHDPSKFPNKISVPVVDRKKAFIDFLNAGGKVGEKPVVENNENIKGNTFHGRKWRSHMSKASLSNFGKEEKYVMLMPPIPAAIQIENKANSPVKDRKELDVIKDHLQTDVAGSQQKYISNIMEVDELDQKIYGESLKKYLDVLNYEKANYNGVDASKIGEAADLVDIIYEAKERALIKKKGAQKIRSAPIEEEEEEANVNDEDRIDKSDPRFSKHVPRSKLFIKGRSSVTSSARDSIHVAPHDNHSSLRGKRGIISPDVVRTSTGNSAALQTEISSLNATAKDGKFAKV